MQGKIAASVQACPLTHARPLLCAHTAGPAHRRLHVPAGDCAERFWLHWCVCARANVRACVRANLQPPTASLIRAGAAPTPRIADVLHRRCHAMRQPAACHADMLPWCSAGRPTPPVGPHASVQACVHLPTHASPMQGPKRAGWPAAAVQLQCAARGACHPLGSARAVQPLRVSCPTAATLAQQISGCKLRV